MSFFQRLITDPILALAFLLSVVLAVTVHEFSHAYVADRLGDPTPGSQGRISLSPLAHLDPLGSLAFLLIGFGWGKPVMYDPSYFRNRFSELWVALAGPASNVALAILMNILLTFLPGSNATTLIIGMIIKINVTLAAFNLLPFPPLDGSSIIAAFWPEYRSPRYAQIGSIALLAILFLAPPLLGTILSPVIQFITFLSTLFGLLH